MKFKLNNVNKQLNKDFISKSELSNNINCSKKKNKNTDLLKTSDVNFIDYIKSNKTLTI